MTTLMNYDLKCEESREDFITNEESGLFSALDDEGNMVSIKMENRHGMEIITYQCNDWARVAEYDESGHFIGEEYEKMNSGQTMEYQMHIKQKRAKIWEQLSTAYQLEPAARKALKEEYLELLRK
ncbi:MAG: hypothetical protein R3267_07780 [Paenisporosarcina sp.]|nr:hypothetical protein [Paenisporosarcina sp.]